MEENVSLGIGGLGANEGPAAVNPSPQHPGAQDAPHPSVAPAHEAATRAAEVTAPDRRIRQAVVVIHGIGEQQPMDTLRGFVDAVLADVVTSHDPYRSKPDAMNESMETRCLQAPANHRLSRPLTDFYEFYWAHHMQGSKYTHVLRWLRRMMSRRPGAVPRPLRPAYALSWLVLLVVASLWAASAIRATQMTGGFFDRVWPQMGLLLSGLTALAAQWLGSHLILGYVADAARYLTPSPDNIEARNKIRSEGMKLLRTLHSSGRYKRIVVVGHSLGSVIGYDLIRNLWAGLRKPSEPNPQKQPALKGLKHVAEALESGDATPEQVDAFQRAQHDLWQELREVGVPWLITDFVTLGSPLAHAQLLMSDDPDDFARKKRQYEYPCCPPPLDEELFYGQQYRITKGGEALVRNVFVPHHGAPFSCTRWTNLYFPYRRLVLGDIVGGPLRGAFGHGVRDRAVVSSTGRRLDATLVSHVRYWTGGAVADAGQAEGGARASLGSLREALRLDFLRETREKANRGRLVHNRGR